MCVECEHVLMRYVGVRRFDACIGMRHLSVMKDSLEYKIDFASSVNKLILFI